MKQITTYITERIQKLPNHIKGLVVFDIDDTLLRVNKDMVAIYKNVNGKEIKLSTEDFAKDPDASNPNKSYMFDLRDFRDPIKIYNSIMSGTPLIKNLRIMDNYINAGYDFCFLTARGCEEIIKKAMEDFLKFRDESGALKELGNSFKKAISSAVNDEFKKYPGVTDAEKKANVLIRLCRKYDKVVFVDDDHKNIAAARSLNIPNLRVIKAWDE